MLSRTSKRSYTDLQEQVREAARRIGRKPGESAASLFRSSESVQRNAPDRLADTVDEFCARVGISRRHFYALLRRGEGPRTVTIGRRRLIHRAAGEAWLCRQETRMT